MKSSNQKELNGKDYIYRRESRTKRSGRSLRKVKEVISVSKLLYIGYLLGERLQTVTTRSKNHNVGLLRNTKR